MASRSPPIPSQICRRAIALIADSVPEDNFWHERCLQAKMGPAEWIVATHDFDIHNEDFMDSMEVARMGPRGGLRGTSGGSSTASTPPSSRKRRTSFCIAAWPWRPRSSGGAPRRRRRPCRWPPPWPRQDRPADGSAMSAPAPGAPMWLAFESRGGLSRGEPSPDSADLLWT